MNTTLLIFTTTLSKNNSRRKRPPLFTVKTACAMNEYYVNITIQRQVNESWELNNYLTVFILGDSCHLAANIRVRLITYNEKEKMQSCKLNLPHILEWSYQFYTGKNLLILKTDHLLSETEQVQVDHSRVSTIYHRKMPYHAVLLNSCAESNRNTKRNYKHYQKTFMDIYAIRLFHTPELVLLSQMKVK